MGAQLAGRHVACPAAGVVLAFRRPVRAPASVTPLRALYDAAGRGPSWLARSLAGRRITCSGLVGSVPSGAAGWLALGEDVIAPCPACGGDHDWPVGVLAVQAPCPPGTFAVATLRGVLDLCPGAGDAAGMGGRLALRDAAVVAP
ncbi:hypothetical protein [Falsiroseomonas sp. CW058]|uniref:hypothetical protein n=1 Tax=Falsiroseomonas sp. CW058 TaxID=3388664 RepID=UPI003D31ACF0